MSDYCSYPLWGLDDDNIGDIDPKSLPLSETTIQRLEKWADIYDAILNWDDPASSGFASQEAKEAFEQEGISLWLQLRKELSSDYEVLYFSNRLQREVSDLNELMALAK